MLNIVIASMCLYFAARCNEVYCLGSHYAFNTSLLCLSSLTTTIVLLSESVDTSRFSYRANSIFTIVSSQVQKGVTMLMAALWGSVVQKNTDYCFMAVPSSIVERLKVVLSFVSISALSFSKKLVIFR